MRVQRGHGARDVAGGDGLAHVGRQGHRDVLREQREKGLQCSTGPRGSGMQKGM
jgi:hypothetical protein